MHTDPTPPSYADMAAAIEQIWVLSNPAFQPDGGHPGCHALCEALMHRLHDYAEAQRKVAAVLKPNKR